MKHFLGFPPPHFGSVEALLRLCCRILFSRFGGALAFARIYLWTPWRTCHAAAAAYAGTLAHTPHILVDAVAYLAHTPPPPPRFTWRDTTTAFRLRSGLVSDVEV